jgi:uncharacterized membrane protein
MRTPIVAIMAGAVLGLLDGLSAWVYPEARAMMIPIVAGSTIKGVITGLVVGLIAQGRRSAILGIVIGAAVGFTLSALAAIGEPDHYWSIVLPGMLVGVIVGVIAQRRRVGSGAIVLVLAVAGHSLSAQTTEATQSLAVLDGLIGTWQGTAEGEPGRGTVEREYTRVLRSQFVRSENTSVYAPQEKNPKGEQHEDVGYFSFDRQRKQVILRQFHVEGFVNHYVLRIVTTSTLVFETEAIENIPAGFRARETYRLVGPDEFEETFELAEPGKPFAVYSRSKFRRVK